MHAGSSIDELKQVSGWLCLDFCNTADRMQGVITEDWMNTGADVLAWGQRVGILNDGATVVGVGALESAHILRELLYRIFSRLAAGEKPLTNDLDTFNDLLRDAMEHARIISDDEGYKWVWAAGSSATDSVMWTVMRSAADLLTAPELRQLRQCAADDCGWLFLDTSRNHGRRWCDMEDCGNRAKARRFYAKTKGD